MGHNQDSTVVKLETIEQEETAAQYEMHSLITRNERRSILMAEKFHGSDSDQHHQEEARPHQRLWLSNDPPPQSLRNSGIEDPDPPAFKTQLEVDAMEEPVNQLEAGAES